MSDGVACVAEGENAAADAPLSAPVTLQTLLSLREETFLARWPRAVKLALLAFLFFSALGAFFFWGGAEQRAPSLEGGGTYQSGEEEEAIDLSSIPMTLDRSPSKERRAPNTPEEEQAAVSNDLYDEPMSAAPDMALAEPFQGGVLPKIGADGQRPWQVYARPFDFRDPRPRIALVVGDLGLSRLETDAALRRLPKGVTLAFDAQGGGVGEWLARARQDGFETLLSLPMEPLDYPRNDPGAHTLLAALPVGDRIERMKSALKVASGYVGITTMTGSRLTAEADKIAPILEEARRRGLLVLDPHLVNNSVLADMAASLKVPSAQSVRFIDIAPTPQAIDAALAQIEGIARVEGVAVAMATPLPVTLERIEAWAKELGDRGVVLASLSAVVR